VSTSRIFHVFSAAPHIGMNISREELGRSCKHADHLRLARSFQVTMGPYAMVDDDPADRKLDVFMLVKRRNCKHEFQLRGSSTPFCRIE
jgi:hypothetical protein